MKAKIESSRIYTNTNNVTTVVQVPIDVFDRLLKTDNTCRNHTTSYDFDICAEVKALYHFKHKDGVSTYKGYVNASFIYNSDGLTVIFNTDGMREKGNSTTLGNCIMMLTVPYWDVTNYIKHLKKYAGESA